MKRDMDLIRKLLLHYEELLPSKTNELFDVRDIKLEDYSTDAIQYHTKLLEDAGFLEMLDDLTLFRLTWEGCEFLETARNNERWEKTKRILESLGPFAAPIVKEVLTGMIKEQIKSLGIP